MRLLKGATECGDYALFDPAAMLASVNASFDAWSETIPEHARSGALALYAAACDGDARAAILVEEADAKLESWRSGGGRGLLQVPSGRLVFGGIELMQTDHPISEADAYVLDPTLGDELRVPPGTYEVDAFEVDVPEEVAREIEEKVREEVGSLVVRLRDLLGIATALSFALLAIALFFSLISLMTNGRESIAFAARHYGLVVFGLPFVVFALNWLPVLRRVDAARDAAECALPNVAFVLTRLPAGAVVSGRHGVAFGAGAREPAVSVSPRGA